MRRRYTAALHSTQVLGWRSQMGHGLHLFCVIAAAVIGRNVANQELLDLSGPRVLGKLYITVSVVAGLAVAAVGVIGRKHDVRRVAVAVHLGVAVLLLASFGASLVFTDAAAAAILKYILIEIAATALLLAFGITLGASLGPREARRTAARVGLGGILGGLVAGLALKFGAPWVGSHYLYILAAAFAVAPIFWMPTPEPSRRTASAVPRPERAEVEALAPYGRWVAITTLVMVATTTIIDFQYRAAAATWYRADSMTSFFGDVTLLTGLLTMVLQLTLVDGLLDRVGLFATATVMPSALIICSAAFGLAPMHLTLVLLKLVDSGTNMTVQQATGGLLLAPLSPRARALWQGRIDGLAKRGGQALAGLFLAAFPLAPARLAPVALMLCAIWLVSVLITRLRYLELLTDMLGAPGSNEPEVEVYDGSTLRRLLKELETAQPTRAAVILDLLEQVGEQAPAAVLQRLADADASGATAVRVVQHYATLSDAAGLRRFAQDPTPEVASAALTALAELAPQSAEESARQVLARPATPDPLRALAAGILIDRDRAALELCRSLASSAEVQTRVAAARALGLARPTLTFEVTPTLTILAEDANAEVARTALSSLARHPTSGAVDVAIRLFARRELRGAAKRALADLGFVVVTRVSGELEEQLQKNEDPRLIAALAWVLGRSGSALGVPALLAALASPHIEVRLAAAAALNSMRRRNPRLEIPYDQLQARYLPEIEFFARMREASLCELPRSPAAELLHRAFRERANASLETLFRMMSLQYPEDAIQGAYRAISSHAGRDRQIALELLDNLLEADVRQALDDAVGEKDKKTGRRDARKILTALAREHDRFLGGLARVVLVEMGAAPVSALKDKMTQTLVSQVLELQALTLFQHSSAEDLAEVAALVAPRLVPAKTVIFREGDLADAMYVIRSGALEITREGRVVDRLGPGDACGIIAVLDQLPREVTATTVSECSLLVINGDALVQLLADRPTLMHGIFRALTGSIRSQLERVNLERRARA